MDGEGEGALAGLGAGVLGVLRARIPADQLGQRVGVVAAAALVGCLGGLGGPRRLGRPGRLGRCVGVGGAAVGSEMG